MGRGELEASEDGKIWCLQGWCEGPRGVASRGSEKTRVVHLKAKVVGAALQMREQAQTTHFKSGRSHFLVVCPEAALCFSVRKQTVPLGQPVRFRYIPGGTLSSVPAAFHLSAPALSPTPDVILSAGSPRLMANSCKSSVRLLLLLLSRFSRVRLCVTP